MPLLKFTLIDENRIKLFGKNSLDVASVSVVAENSEIDIRGTATAIVIKIAIARTQAVAQLRYFVFFNDHRKDFCLNKY